MRSGSSPTDDTSSCGNPRCAYWRHGDHCADDTRELYQQAIAAPEVLPPFRVFPGTSVDRPHPALVESTRSARGGDTNLRSSNMRNLISLGYRALAATIIGLAGKLADWLGVDAEYCDEDGTVGEPLELDDPVDAQWAGNRQMLMPLPVRAEMTPAERKDWDATLDYYEPELRAQLRAAYDEETNGHVA